MTSAPPETFDAFFYEAFAEEAERLLHYAAAAGLRVGHSPLTIQETGHAAPPAPVVSLRTQSIFPPAWAPLLRGILTRSTGYDHLFAYRDAVASIRRWGAKDSMGQKLMGVVADLSAPDAKTIKMVLKEPYGQVLESLGKSSSNAP